MKDQKLQVRAKPEFRLRLKEGAKAANLPVAVFIRLAIDEKIEKLARQNDRLREALERLAVSHARGPEDAEASGPEDAEASIPVCARPHLSLKP